jgi:hypothetical protein
MFSISWMSVLESIFYCIWGAVVIKMASLSIKKLLQDWPKNYPFKLFQSIALYSFLILGTVAYSALLSGWTFVILEMDFLKMTIINTILALPIVFWETSHYFRK